MILKKKTWEDPGVSNTATPVIEKKEYEKNLIMKKIALVLSIAAIAGLLVACNKQNPTQELSPMTISATIDEAADDATKTDFNPANCHVTWRADDYLYVFAPYKAEFRPAGYGSGTVGFQRFNVTSRSNENKNAEFTAKDAHDWTDAKAAVAFYARENIQAYFGGTNQYFVRLVYPSTQAYNIDNNPRKQLLYMRSDKVYITGADFTPLQNLSFRHLTSIVKIPVIDSGNNGVTLSSIRLDVTGTAICGIWYGFSVSKTTYDNMDTSFGWGSGEDKATGNKHVTLTGIDTEMTSTIKNFYIVIAPGTHGTLTVTLTPSAGDAKVFTYSGAFGTDPGKVYNFPVINWSAK